MAKKRRETRKKSRPKDAVKQSHVNKCKELLISVKTADMASSFLGKHLQNIPLEMGKAFEIQDFWMKYKC
jgi:hypothetical protein